MHTVYTITHHGEMSEPMPELETALSEWDGIQHHAGPARPGDGIEVQAWDEDGMMVRDGWVVHVLENGSFYVNPQIAR